jgi:hypothetical protein
VYVWNLHYYLQAYVVFALAVAAGVEAYWPRWLAHRPVRQVAAAGVAVLFPILLYLVTPSIARAFARNVPDFRPLPGRDNLTYALTPWKQNETGARDLGEGILRDLPPASVLFADYSLWAVVHYLQIVEGAHPDVTLVELPDAGTGGQGPLILRFRADPNLFLADTYRYYDVTEIGEQFVIVPHRSAYQLVSR